MSARPRRPPSRRLEAWLWTGPVGHLAGGILDFAGVFAREALRRRAAGRRRRAALRLGR